MIDVILEDWVNGEEKNEYIDMDEEIRKMMDEIDGLI